VKLILIKLAANAALLYGLALMCGGRIKFRGLVPVLSVAIFLVPLNVFMVEIVGLAGLDPRPIYVFAAAVVCNGVMLYALSYVIPQFTVENLPIALAFALLMGAVSLFLNFFLADQLAGVL